jgi:hypothetical protein
MAMSFMATHLYLTQKVETFFIGGKTLLPNKESVYLRCTSSA